jgi:hypothetical protein
MPNPLETTFEELRNEIKLEARVKGSDTLDPFIDDLINELLLDYCQKNRYSELLVLNHAIATLQSTGNYDLPEDFMAERLIRYQAPNGASRTLHKRNQYLENARGSYPRYYDIAARTLQIFPDIAIPANDSILLDYYKFPNFEDDDEPFPIPKLIPVIKRTAVHRVLVYNRDFQTAAVHRGESAESEVRTKPAT